MAMFTKVGLICLLLCALASVAEAQAPEFVRVSDTLSSNGDSFVVAVRGPSSDLLEQGRAGALEHELDVP